MEIEEMIWRGQNNVNTHPCGSAPCQEAHKHTCPHKGSQGTIKRGKKNDNNQTHTHFPFSPTLGMPLLPPFRIYRAFADSTHTPKKSLACLQTGPCTSVCFASNSIALTHSYTHIERLIASLIVTHAHLYPTRDRETQPPPQQLTASSNSYCTRGHYPHHHHHPHKQEGRAHRNINTHKTRAASFTFCLCTRRSREEARNNNNQQSGGSIWLASGQLHHTKATDKPRSSIRIVIHSHHHQPIISSLLDIKVTHTPHLVHHVLHAARLSVEADGQLGRRFTPGRPACLLCPGRNDLVGLRLGGGSGPGTEATLGGGRDWSLSMGWPGEVPELLLWLSLLVLLGHHLPCSRPE